MAPRDPTGDTGRFQQLRRLTEVGRALTYVSTPEEVLRLTVRQAAGLLDAERALLMLDDDDGLLHIRAAHGVADAELERFRPDAPASLLDGLDGVLRRTADDRFLGVPLVARGRVTGLLAVMAPPGEPFGEEDEWLLSALADQSALALEYARLDAEVRQRLEERVRLLEEEQTAKQTALATLAHDLRAPLNATVAYAEVLETGALGPLEERQRDALRRIRASGRHILGLVETILDAALLTAGVTAVRPRTVRAAEVMEEAETITRPEALAKGQTLEVAPPGGLLLHADPDRLRQVLVNLLENAIKYTPEGGRIRMHARSGASAGAGWATIAVEDTGSGIPTDQLEAIFEPYRRAVGVADVPGAGLGLAISRGLVRQMGGEIEVVSEPGRGSVFTLRLPLASGGEGGQGQV